MNEGRTLFAQVMDFVPWKTFGRIIERHAGDAGIRTLDCADLFRIMAFSQLTWRESLRDIAVCLAANHTKLFHMGLRGVPARSTLADALNGRDWRIFHALAIRLIARARKLYAADPLDVELDATVYALDATTLDLCLSLFGYWAPFRRTKAAVKLHTLLDLRGLIPTFIHISDGKMADVRVLDSLPVEAGAFYIMADISPSGLNSRDFAFKFLRERGVSVAPGTAFGEVGKNAVRISLASSDQDLREGVGRLAEFVRLRS